MKINYNKLLKSFCYRVVSSTITFVISSLITGSAKIGLSIGIIDLCFKVANYYFFDNIWDSIFKTNIKSCVIWLTGLSGSGKTTIAEELIRKFQKKNVKYVLLDGDQIRNVIKQNGFDYNSRKTHNLNVAYMASLLESQGNVVIVSLVSPYREVRNDCRKICKNFVEVFVNTPLSVCEKRDVKGLYKKARAGEIKEFTGIDSPYENPLEPEISIETIKTNPQESSNSILKYITNIK